MRWVFLTCLTSLLLCARPGGDLLQHHDNNELSNDEYILHDEDEEEQDGGAIVFVKERAFRYPRMKRQLTTACLTCTVLNKGQCCSKYSKCCAQAGGGGVQAQQGGQQRGVQQGVQQRGVNQGRQPIIVNQGRKPTVGQQWGQRQQAGLQQQGNTNNRSPGKQLRPTTGGGSNPVAAGSGRQFLIRSGTCPALNRKNSAKLRAACLNRCYQDADCPTGARCCPQPTMCCRPLEADAACPEVLGPQTCTGCTTDQQCTGGNGCCPQAVSQGCCIIPCNRNRRPGMVITIGNGVPALPNRPGINQPAITQIVTQTVILAGNDPDTVIVPIGQPVPPGNVVTVGGPPPGNVVTVVGPPPGNVVTVVGPPPGNVVTVGGPPPGNVVTVVPGQGNVVITVDATASGGAIITVDETKFVDGPVITVDQTKTFDGPIITLERTVTGDGGPVAVPGPGQVVTATGTPGREPEIVIVQDEDGNIVGTETITPDPIFHDTDHTSATVIEKFAGSGDGQGDEAAMKEHVFSLQSKMPELPAGNFLVFPTLEGTVSTHSSNSWEDTKTLPVVTESVDNTPATLAKYIDNNDIAFEAEQSEDEQSQIIVTEPDSSTSDIPDTPRDKPISPESLSSQDDSSISENHYRKDTHDQDKPVLLGGESEKFDAGENNQVKSESSDKITVTVTEDIDDDETHDDSVDPSATNSLLERHETPTSDASSLLSETPVLRGSLSSSNGDSGSADTPPLPIGATHTKL